MASILSIGVNKQMLARRHKLLLEAGFDVVSSTLGDTLRQLVGDSRFQVAIFGSNVPEASRNKIAADLIRNCPHIKIVMLYEGGIHRAEMADAVLTVNVHPADLVQTIHYLIGKQKLDRRGRGRSA